MAEIPCSQRTGIILLVALDAADQLSRARLESHMQSCPACAGRFRSVLADLESFSAWSDTPPPADVVAALLAAARQSSRTPPGRRDSELKLTDDARAAILEELDFEETGESEEFGSTPLPWGGTRGTTRRISSRLLARVKSELPGHRTRRKRARWLAVLWWILAVSGGLHVLVLLLAWMQVFTISRPRQEILLHLALPDRKEHREKPPPKVEEPADDPSPRNPPGDPGRHKKPERKTEGSSTGGAPVIKSPSVDKKKKVRYPGRAGHKGQWGEGRRGGGSIPAVDRALQWLALHQSPDGRWAWTGFTACCARHGGPACTHGVNAMVAREGRNFDTGLTGLVLLCFLGSGYTHRPLPIEDEVSDLFRERHRAYAPVVQRALAYLMEAQEKDGCYGPKADLDLEGYMYNHGICTLAAAEAYHMTRDDEAKRSLRRALEFLYTAQNPRTGGWDYVAFADHRGSCTRTDTSVSSWQVMALKAAKDAGLPVDEAVWRRARQYVRKMVRRDGSFCYAQGMGGDVSKEHGRRRSMGVSAAGLLSLLYLGADKGSRLMRKGILRLRNNLPDLQALSREAGPAKEFNFHSVYYWYYGTLVLCHTGGVYWESWQERLFPLLERSQVSSGSMKGTWNPVGSFLGTYGGRLYVTALNVLNLEVVYRVEGK